MNKFLHENFTKLLQVNVEVVIIENDTVVKAILDLISLLQIRKLILGSSKARSLLSLKSKQTNSFSVSKPKCLMFLSLC